MGLALERPDLKPASVYLHVPFCRRRCGYCNFSVITGRLDLAPRIVDAMLAELRQQVDEHPPRRPVETIFVGGGTPTQLGAEDWQRLAVGLGGLFVIDDATEWTTEANPEDFDRAMAVNLAKVGVNRISFGVQSFQDRKLSTLQRGHTGREAIAAINRAAERFDNLSVDLIFGAPGETLADWHGDLRTALSLPISHLSTYSLTIEKGTTFWNRDRRGELPRCDEDLDLAMYQAARSMASDHGMRQYEVSSFAVEGSRCRHNLAYWHGRDWYAAGPSATRFLGGVRSTAHRSVTTYLKRIELGQSAVTDREPIDSLEYAAERMAFGLRMIDGVNLADVSRQTGIDLSRQFAVAIQRCRRSGWIRGDGDHLRLTERGILFADSVANEFLAVALEVASGD